MQKVLSERSEMDKNDELRIVKNFLANMPKTYRRRNANWSVVRDILMQGTHTAGMTSSMHKCWALGIDPDGYTLDKCPEKSQEV